MEPHPHDCDCCDCKLPIEVSIGPWDPGEDEGFGVVIDFDTDRAYHIDPHGFLPVVGYSAGEANRLGDECCEALNRPISTE